MFSQVASRWSFPSLDRNDICVQPLITMKVLFHQHDAMLHLRVLRKCGFNLGEFDAIAAHLDLPISAPQILQFTVPPIPALVSGSV
jgi:hypothetical protein